MEIRSESVQGPTPEARELYVEEGGPGLANGMNHVGDMSQEGDGSHEGGDGGQEPGKQSPEEPGHVATAAQAQQPRNRP